MLLDLQKDLFFQNKDPASGTRATLVDCARTRGKALQLHTEPGDTDVAFSGLMERSDGYHAHRGTADPVAYAGCEMAIEHSIFMPSTRFRMPIGESYNLADLHGGRKDAAAANLAVGFVNWNSAMKDKLGWLQIQLNTGDPTKPTEHAVALCVPQFDKWYDFRHELRLSSGDDGYCRSYLNGDLVMDHQDCPTMYASDFVYFKLANYHAVRTDIPNVASSVIHDRLRISA